MEAFVSIQLEKVGLRDEMLNSYLEKKQAVGGLLQAPVSCTQWWMDFQGAEQDDVCDRLSVKSNEFLSLQEEAAKFKRSLIIEFLKR